HLGRHGLEEEAALQGARRAQAREPALGGYEGDEGSHYDEEEIPAQVDAPGQAQLGQGNPVQQLLQEAEGADPAAGDPSRDGAHQSYGGQDVEERAEGQLELPHLGGEKGEGVLQAADGARESGKGTGIAVEARSAYVLGPALVD